MDNLFIDITDDQLTTLNILFGGRGIGKTFSILKHRVENSIACKGRFIWLRDTDAVIKKIAAGNSLTLPIENAVEGFPHVEIRKIEGNYIFCTIDEETNQITAILGYLMALSTFHNARGLSYEDVTCIVWDEMIPEEGTLVRKHQGQTFLNMYESVNRNRELTGGDPCQIIFLSNTNDIYSEVLEDLGVSKIIESMQLNQEACYRDGDIWIEFMSNQVFLDKKKETFIYRIQNNEKFANMALNNKFNNSLVLIKPNMDLKGSKGLINVNLKYVLVQLSDGNLYWKLGTYKNIMNYDIENDQEAILFRILFADKLRIKYITGNMFFDSIYTQRKILEYAKI